MSGLCMGLCMRCNHRETDFPMGMMRFESFKREEGLRSEDSRFWEGKY